MTGFTKTVSLILVVIMAASLLAGCSGTAAPSAGSTTEKASVETAEVIDLTEEQVPLASGVSSYAIPRAAASGKLVASNDKAVIDYSNTADGYIMIKYLGSNPKVKVILTGPSGTGYTYNLGTSGDWDVFSLSDGNGAYKASVYENVSGTKYSTAASCSFSVSLKDEFAPFLLSNKYVSFTADGLAATKAAELTASVDDTLDRIAAVYNYVVDNIAYDYDLADNVASGYIPNIDSVLKSGKGICFDYAAVMTAMLRSLGIPTKLVVGYTGSAYHAWISTYSRETGWVDGTIYFDGSQWKLMDPTFAASGKGSEDIAKYIGDGSNYSAKYLY